MKHESFDPTIRPERIPLIPYTNGWRTHTSRSLLDHFHSDRR